MGTFIAWKGSTWFSHWNPVRHNLISRLWIFQCFRTAVRHNYLFCYPARGNVWDNTCNPCQMQLWENVSDCLNLMPHQINGSATIIDWDGVMLLFQSCQSTSVVLQKMAMSYFSSLWLMMEIQSMGPLTNYSWLVGIKFKEFWHK